MKIIHLCLILLFSIFALAGCATNPYGDSYGAKATRQIQTVHYGTILQADPVTIEGGEGGQLIGTIAGAAVGGILGSKVGSGSGSDIAAIGGGILGGVAGNKAGEAVSRRNGVNLTIQLDDGEIIAIVQEVNPNMIFRVGQKVQVNISGDQARVVPAY